MSAKEEQKVILYGPDGKEIKTITVPTVKFRDFQFAIQTMKSEDVVRLKPGQGARPGDLIQEYRARCLELNDRVQLLTAILCVTLSDGLVAGKEFLDAIGIQVTDLNGKKVYPK